MRFFTLNLFVALISWNAFAATQVKYFEQKLNHQDASDKRTFKQKYIINTDYASGPDSPVLFHVNGVNDMSERYFDKNFNRFIADKFKMNFVGLEHRFYGNSSPFEQLTNENLKFLNLHNSIEDLANFQKAMRSAGFTGPWINIGGSYAGSLAAYFKVQYPSEVVGTISSCASLYRRREATVYDQITVNVIGSTCYQKYQQTLDKIATSEDGVLQAYREAYKATDIAGRDGLLGYLGGNSAFYIEIRGPRSFCEAFEKPDPVLALAEILNDFNKEWKAVPTAWTPEGVQDLDQKKYSVGIGQRQWMYQTCTEMGNLNYFGDPNRSMYHPMAHSWLQWKRQCGFYGLTRPPYVEETNSRFYENLLKPSTRDILFLNNAEDPVSQGAISKENGNDTNPNTVSHTIPSSAHCEELRMPKPTDSQQVIEARDLILKMVGQWLKK